MLACVAGGIVGFQSAHQQAAQPRVAWGGEAEITICLVKQEKEIQLYKPPSFKAPHPTY